MFEGNRALNLAAADRARANLLPAATEVVLNQLQIKGRKRIVMISRPVRDDSCCPVCQQRSDRIQEKLNRLQQRLPDGLAVDAAWLESNGYLKQEGSSNPGGRNTMNVVLADFSERGRRTNSPANSRLAENWL